MGERGRKREGGAGQAFIWLVMGKEIDREREREVEKERVGGGERGAGERERLCDA